MHKALKQALTARKNQANHISYYSQMYCFFLKTIKIVLKMGFLFFSVASEYDCQHPLGFATRAIANRRSKFFKYKTNFPLSQLPKLLVACAGSCTFNNFELKRQLVYEAFRVIVLSFLKKAFFFGLKFRLHDFSDL